MRWVGQHSILMKRHGYGACPGILHPKHSTNKQAPPSSHLGAQLRQRVDGAAGVHEAAPVLLAGQAVVHEGKGVWHEVRQDEAVTLAICCSWLLLLLLLLARWWGCCRECSWWRHCCCLV